jgi:hypothetical protein
MSFRITVSYSHDVASHSPQGLNFTEEIALVWPANVYLIT